MQIQDLIRIHMQIWKLSLKQIFPEKKDEILSEIKSKFEIQYKLLVNLASDIKLQDYGALSADKFPYLALFDYSKMN